MKLDRNTSGEQPCKRKAFDEISSFSILGTENWLRLVLEGSVMEVSLSPLQSPISTSYVVVILASIHLKSDNRCFLEQFALS
jgi:hypothetical protein